jgi:hypothetical protein
MFDNLFSSSPAVWTGLIAGMIALPILVHLINLMRHKTVQWAAMEFLLKSYQKNRNWVWLKQLLLLVARIAALVLALLMLAQIGCQQDQISKLLGGATTHHYVLLDDSYSMGDRGTGGSAFDRARSTLSLIASRAKNRENQLFTLLRFSASRPYEEDSAASDPDSQEMDVERVNQMADLSAELVDNQFDQRIEDVKARLTVSSLSVGLRESLQTVTQLIQQRENENAIVYVVSDFRRSDWENPAEADQLMTEIRDRGAAVELITCAGTERPNLALTELEPAGNVRVSGTPLMMKLTVKNCSRFNAEKIQVKLGAFTYPAPSQDTIPETTEADFAELPTVFIESISPGGSETRTFPVFFNSTGQHVVLATLPDDAVDSDNVRWNCTEFASMAKVLLVDGQGQMHSEFVSLAINPGSMTGISPETRTREFLRDTTPEVLAQYDVLFLLDVAALDESAIRNVEMFAHSGGGVAFFLGPNTNINSVNQFWYRDGEGIFPLPLEQVIEVPELVDEKIPDVAPNQHPMFAPVFGVKDSLLDLVQVKQAIRPPLDWINNPSPDVSVVATVRGVQSWPLIVEKAFGKGRVIAFTTTAGPVWNNWSRNATFPPIMLLMEDYLAEGKFSDVQNLVGTSIQVAVPASEYLPQMTLLAPDGIEGSRSANEMRMTESSEASQLVAKLGRRLPGDSIRETDLPGIYGVWLRKTDSSQQVERFAFNVDTSESEMAIVDPQKLLADLESARPTFVTWDAFNPEPKQKPASSLSRLLLGLLISILVVEQLLAYSSSYHRSRAG